MKAIRDPAVGLVPHGWLLLPGDVEVLVADARLSEPAELGIVGRPTRPGASVLVASSLG